jgi:hypothetical protein
MGDGTRMRTRAAAAAISVTLAAAGPAALAPAARGAGAGATPACTQTALQAGLSRGTAKVVGAKVVKPFGCSGRWAYAAVNTKRFTLTSLFHAQGGQWVTADRTKPCSDGAVPRAIHKLACETN